MDESGMDNGVNINGQNLKRKKKKKYAKQVHSVQESSDYYSIIVVTLWSAQTHSACRTYRTLGFPHNCRDNNENLVTDSINCYF